MGHAGAVAAKSSNFAVPGSVSRLYFAFESLAGLLASHRRLHGEARKIHGRPYPPAAESFISGSPAWMLARSGCRIRAIWLAVSGPASWPYGSKSPNPSWPSVGTSPCPPTALAADIKRGCVDRGSLESRNSLSGGGAIKPCSRQIVCHELLVHLKSGRARIAVMARNRPNVEARKADQ